MKAFTLLVALGLAVGLVLAGTDKMETKPTGEMKAMGKTHDLTVEVVSADAKAKTLTIKDENGQPKSVPVMGKAIASLATLKAGDKITVTCQDNDKGEHQGITAIKVAKGAGM